MEEKGNIIIFVIDFYIILTARPPISIRFEAKKCYVITLLEVYLKCLALFIFVYKVTDELA